MRHVRDLGEIMKLLIKKSRLVLWLAALTIIAAQNLAVLGATVTYPIAACNTSLQACINAASPGDTVQVATNFPISEDLMISKSLTVRAAAGFSPVLNDFAEVSLFNLGDQSNNIVFEGFTFDPGY